MPGTRTAPDEVLAICRLRQWAADRATMKSGHASNYTRQGWRERRTRDADARLVRFMNFEPAWSRPTPEHQSTLLLTYREHQPRPGVNANRRQCSRTELQAPAARQALARTLDLLDLR